MHNRFFSENFQYVPLTFFKEVFTDTLCVDRYAGPKLNCKHLTIKFGLLKMTFKNQTVKTGYNNWTVETGL